MLKNTVPQMATRESIKQSIILNFNTFTARINALGCAGCGALTDRWVSVRGRPSFLSPFKANEYAKEFECIGSHHTVLNDDSNLGKYQTSKKKKKKTLYCTTCDATVTLTFLYS